MTTILLILSVAMNVCLFVWALAIMSSREDWKNESKRREKLAEDWQVAAMNWKAAAEGWKKASDGWKNRRYATSASPSIPGTSTESPTPAPDAD